MSQQDLSDPAERLEKPSRRRALFAARDLALAAAAAPALPALAQSPATATALRVMHGFADLEGITLWLQAAAPQSLRVEVRPENGGAPRTLAVELALRDDCAASLRIDGLDAGVVHRYSVFAPRGSVALAAGSFRTQAHWHFRTDPPTVRIAAGSCAYLNDGRYDRPGKPYGGGEQIFDAIAGLEPDVMLWLGDNIYLREPEWNSRSATSRRYRFYRDHPSTRRLWSATPHLAIWDDHDYGPNDGDGSFVNRRWTREMFLRYWPLPYDPPQDGLYGMVTQGDVDLFLLDDRSYRSPNDYPVGPEKGMFGAAQMQWLKAALVSSRAPFKIVCGGNQFLNQASRFETWARFPDEQQSLLRFLAAAKVPGVIFLSGDRHYASMLRVERPGFYPLHEVTTSPLTSAPFADPPAAERGNPDLVPGTLLNERNFALFTVTGPRLARALKLEIRDGNGDKRWEWSTTAAELAQGTRA